MVSSILSFSQVLDEEKAAYSRHGSSIIDESKGGSNYLRPLKSHYFSAGVGFDPKAHPPMGLATTFIFSNNFGVSLSLKSKSFKAVNLPPNFRNKLFDFGLLEDERKLDFLKVVSLNLTREYFSRSEKFSIGFEAGPSYVKYNKAMYTHVPTIYSNHQGMSAIFIGKGELYSVSREIKETLGLSLRTKLAYNAGSFGGMELAAFANINKFHPYAGFELYVNLGRMR